MKRVIALCIVLCVGVSCAAAAQESTNGFTVSSKVFNVTSSLNIASLVTIASDGTITYHEGYTPDAAARALWSAISLTRRGTVQLELPADLQAVIDQHLGETPECEDCPTHAQRTAELLLQIIRAHFRAQLQRSAKENAAADSAVLKALNVKGCAAVNAALKAQGAPSLQQCGGGQ